MGCFWSKEPTDKCHRCRREGVNNLIIIDHFCEICISEAVRPKRQICIRPKFGEYRCSKCGRSWSSRLSRSDKYQMCNRCRKPVYPHSQRDLHRSDTTRGKENVQEHPKELCQTCQELGSYCGNFYKSMKCK